MSVKSIAKKRNKKKVVIISFATLIFILVAVLGVVLLLYGDTVVWNNAHPIHVNASSIGDSELSGFSADALHIVRVIENVHPIFIMDGYLPYYYEALRDEFLAIAEGDITQQEFIVAAWRYVTALRDGHMSGFQLLGNPVAALQGDLLNVSWVVYDGRLYLGDNNGALSGVEVIEIGGVTPEEIFALTDLLVFTENEADRERALELYARYSYFIELAGGDIINGRVLLTLSNGDTKEINVNIWQTLNEGNVSNELDFIIRHEMKDDVFFIDLRLFANDPGIDEAVYAIERAIENGTRNFIVDLRGNPGGSSFIGQRLLEAMGITLPSHGSIRRFSEMFPSQAQWLSSTHRLFINLVSPFSRGQMSAPTIESASNPNGVFVSVLTDRFTYSSATMMAVWVQDGGLGNVIGSPSSNAPSAFGDMLRFELPYSELEIRISHARFLRPDSNADQSTLWPDIATDPADALHVALEFLQSR